MQHFIKMQFTFNIPFPFALSLRLLPMTAPYIASCEEASRKAKISKPILTKLTVTCVIQTDNKLTAFKFVIENRYSSRLTPVPP